MKPNKNLIRFHKEVCPELDYDDQKLFFLLVEKINNLNEVKENEEEKPRTNREKR